MSGWFMLYGTGFHPTGFAYGNPFASLFHTCLPMSQTLETTSRWRSSENLSCWQCRDSDNSATAWECSQSHTVDSKEINAPKKKTSTSKMITFLAMHACFCLSLNTVQVVNCKHVFDACFYVYHSTAVNQSFTSQQNASCTHISAVPKLASYNIIPLANVGRQNYVKVQKHLQMYGGMQTPKISSVSSS